MSSIEVLAAQGPVGTRGGVEWMRRPCACPGWGATCLLHAVPDGSRCHQDKHKAQYCSNKKNNKIQKLIHRIERRHSRLVVRLALVLAVELFEYAWVGTQVTFWQQVSGQPRVHLLPQGFLVRTLHLG